MKRRAYILLQGACFILLLGLPLAVSAQSTPRDENGEDPSPHSDVWLVSEVASIQPGSSFTVALRMAMDENWHSYWKNPGDSGEQTTIQWDLPEGFEAGDIQWPYPHRIDVGPLTSYGYSDEVFLLTEITAPATLDPGTDVTLSGRADWLICAEICLLAFGDVERTLPVTAGAPSAGEWSDEIAASRAMLPVDTPEWNVRATRSSGTYALHVMPNDGRRIALDGANFFPDEKATLNHAAPQPVSSDGRAHMIALQQSEYAQGTAERLSGVLVAPDGESWIRGEQARALQIDVLIEEAQAAGISPAAPEERSMSLALALLFAFAGGIILNLMPCVFPILSIKILGFARRSEEAHGDIRRHGLIFAAGVLVSFWILAVLLLALRAGGSQVGWGFQLQSPTFIALMALLFFGIGLSLLGVFEVGMRLTTWGGRMERTASHGSVSGSFLSGVLATVVATPCTAPFMGAALGVALTLSSLDALLIFTALGAGMSLPYVALSTSPSLLRRLPKAGAWMETLKQVLAFPMFATGIWLVWVFGQQVGNNGVALLLFALLLLSVAAWVLGRWSPAQISSRTRIITRTAAAFGLAGAVALSLLGTTYDASLQTSEESGSDAEWRTFSMAAVEQVRAEGRPLFIDFTAAWCLTCQVNKRTTLRSDAVTKAFRKKQVVLMQADWTNQDPEITRALESHGRSGVPLYVLYRGDGSDPVLLPEILTQDLVLEALAAIPSSPSVASKGAI